MRMTLRSIWTAGAALLFAGCVLPAYEVDENLGAAGSPGVLPDLPPAPESCEGPLSDGPDMVPVRGGYCMDSTEVTWRQYIAWAATLTPTALLNQQPPQCSWNLSLFPPNSLDCSAPTETDADLQPVVCVDWCDAWLYCDSMGKRLCGKIGGGELKTQDHADSTASQWTNVCSSGGRNAYPYGDAYDPNACFTPGAGQPTKVQARTTCRSTEPGYTDVYDLSGNVAEWEDACTDDQGEGDFCLARGGSFNDTGDGASCTASRTLLRQSTVDYVGIRCCWDPLP